MFILHLKSLLSSENIELHFPPTFLQNTFKIDSTNTQNTVNIHSKNIQNYTQNTLKITLKIHSEYTQDTHIYTQTTLEIH